MYVYYIHIDVWYILCIMVMLYIYYFGERKVVAEAGGEFVAN